MAMIFSSSFDCFFPSLTILEAISELSRHLPYYSPYQERRLAGLLASALGASRERANAAKDWMALAHHMHWKFPVVMQKLLFDPYCPASIPRETDSLTLGMVNAALDQLASIASGEERSRLVALSVHEHQVATAQQQAAVLRNLLLRCTPAGARWLVSILLRQDLPTGLGDKTVLTAFHADAYEAFTACSDLRRVLDALRRPESAWRRREVEPGLNAAPQLASRVDGGPVAAAACMQGRPFLVETKFDGWRIQNKGPGRVRVGSPAAWVAWYWVSGWLGLHPRRKSAGIGRVGLLELYQNAVACFLRVPSSAQEQEDEGEEEQGAPGAVTAAQLGPCTAEALLPRVVLDGEMLVWNKTRRCFEPFGMLEATIRAAADGVPPNAPVQGRDVAAGAAGAAGTDDSYSRYPAAGELEVVYVAFDILYLRDTSVIHLPLRERKELLASVLRPIRVDTGTAAGAGRGRDAGVEGGSEKQQYGGGVPLGGPQGAVTFRAEALLPDQPMFAAPIPAPAPAPARTASHPGALLTWASCWTFWLFQNDNDGAADDDNTDGKVHSWTCSTAQQAQDVYDRTAAAGEEGVVVKALEEPYRLGCRTSTWIKIKPDYLTQGEFDAVILGQLYDHTTSQVSVGGVYLLGLPEEQPQLGKPTTYVTFAVVGTGVSREQRLSLLEPRLAGNLVASPRDLAAAGPAARLRAVPRWCRATGSRDEWPDWWVRDPERSVVVQVNADVRLTRTSTFAAGYTTRFPRITRIRDDKSPRQATTLRELQDFVRKAAATGGGDGGRGRDAGPGGGVAGGARRQALSSCGAAGADDVAVTPAGVTRGRSSSGRKRPHQQQLRPTPSRVPLHLQAMDLSEVPVHYDLLGGAYVVLEGLYGAAVEKRRGELSRLVRLIGGRLSANYVGTLVTAACRGVGSYSKQGYCAPSFFSTVPSGECRTSYIIVDEWVDSCHPGRDRCRDLLRPSWLEDCYMQRRLIWPPKPSQAWRLSKATLAACAHQMDPYGDPYFELLDEQELAAVLEWHVEVPGAGQPRRALAEAEAEVEVEVDAGAVKGGSWERQRRGRGRGAAEGQTVATTTTTTTAWTGYTGVTSLPTGEAAGPLLRRLEAEMVAHEVELPAGLHRLFSGAVVLLLDLSASLFPQPSAASSTILTSLVAAADTAAAAGPCSRVRVSSLHNAVSASRCSENINTTVQIGSSSGGRAEDTDDADHAACEAAGAASSVTEGHTLGRKTIPLLHSVLEVGALAARWAEEEVRQQLQELQLGVLRGGGELAAGWSPAITHVVLYSGIVESCEATTGGVSTASRAAVRLAECSGAAAELAVAAEPTAPSVPPRAFCAERTLAALREKCTEQQWEAANRELAEYATAERARCSGPCQYGHACGSSNNSRSTSSYYRSLFPGSPSGCEDASDTDTAAEGSEASDLQPSSPSPHPGAVPGFVYGTRRLVLRSGEGSGTAKQEPDRAQHHAPSGMEGSRRRSRERRRRNKLAQLLRRLVGAAIRGCSCSTSQQHPHRLWGCGSACGGGVRVVDERWVAGQRG
ncbi:hypothetical protein VOLCADRAFT_92808 [Volvox carteri f. nagariensis]|uniref:DNA ligase IV n=1 Tax=Volvox carteri f. nagariensis TaxID=3068 RepID=D8U0I6_VOLCA|nr:uncharacterized protein VOLCADRAFT_92808 [Volvox carteri f. nagariensis]EFJ46726.1 hypothetical protein VOLCADRAFT_92808 [Volvox carteri f. nagariensis]|eukprot:XP_002952255.1 hypothetical protein VOLCADRAFT_92808 [Volvox carteri f. nagariensis]